MTAELTFEIALSIEEAEAQIGRIRSDLAAGDYLRITHDFVKKTPDWLRRAMHRHLLRHVKSEDGQSVASPVEPMYGPAATSLREINRAGTSVIIVCYNSLKTIGACLESLFPTLARDDEIVVIDNGSEDKTGTFLIHKLSAWGGPRSETKLYKLLLSEDNLGYSRACNLGLVCASGRTVCFLNPDTTVEGAWLPALRQRLVDEDVGAVGPLTDYVAGDQFVEKHLQGRRPPLKYLGQTLAQLNRAKSSQTKLLVGFCLMLRHETFQTIGLFDEELELGSDDLELALRLRSHGYKLLVAEDVFVHHEGGASFSTVAKSAVQSKLDQSTKAMRRKLQAAFAPDQEPLSEDIWGIGILPQT